MDFTDADLREMIQSAVSRHADARPMAAHGVNAGCADHASHARFAVVRGGDGDGLCIIEPTVRCTHCGFCQSYGH